MTQSTIAPEPFQATMKEKNAVAKDDFPSLVCVSVHGVANALGEGVFQALASHCNLKEL